MGGAWREGASLSLFWCPLSALPPRAPLPECYALREKVCVDGMLVREKALGGVGERCQEKSMR